jgi:hypothetical protein
MTRTRVVSARQDDVKRTLSHDVVVGLAVSYSTLHVPAVSCYRKPCC